MLFKLVVFPYIGEINRYPLNKNQDNTYFHTNMGNMYALSC